MVVDLGGSREMREMVDFSGGVRLWQVQSTGLDHFDLGICKPRNLAVANTPGPFSAIALAECAMMFILMLTRKYHQTQANLNAGEMFWPSGFELDGLKLGLIGFGASGTKLARRAFAFGLQIFAIDTRDDSDDEVHENNLSFMGQLNDLDLEPIRKMPWRTKYGHKRTGSRPASSRIFAPAHPNAAPLSQPTDSSLDHPATGGMTLFHKYVWLFFQGLVPAAAMVDMGDIVSFCNSLMDIIKVIALVSTEMLFDFMRVWALKGQVFNQVISRPLVMLIGSSHLQSQWGTLLIDQNVDFGATFATVGRVLAGLGATKGSRADATIDRLPLPTNSKPLGIELDHLDQDGVEQACLLPSLKTVMDDAAADPKPGSMDSFPLTASPEHIPDAIQSCSVTSPGPSGDRFLRRSRKMGFDELPQFFRHLKVTDIFWLFNGILYGGVSPRY